MFLSGLPRLEAAQRNEAKRFVLLVDTLYDAHARLVILAQGPPEKIYPKGKHGFEFKRTVSRLHEMQAMSWWQGEKA